MPIESKGRMIRRQIGRSERFASLSPDSQRLFVMLIPWLNAHGKMNGEPSYIQGECVPLLKDFTIPKIRKCLSEINLKTNVKWFHNKGLYYIHSLKFLQEHQDIRQHRIGPDLLPSWSTPGVVPEDSGSTPGERRPQVEVEVEVEVKGEVEGTSSGPATKFEKPTLDQIWVYAESIGYKLDADKFLAYYDSNGWRVGRNPMKNWQAAVRTWKIKSEEGGNGTNGGGSKKEAFGRSSLAQRAGPGIGETRPKPNQFAEFGS